MSEMQALPALDETSEPVSELLQDLPPYIARGLVYLLLLLAGVVALCSCIGQIDELVTAPGVAVPQGLSRPLQAAAGGRVTRLVVQEGERVSRDQALVYLETVSASAELERANRERDIRRRELEDLLAAQAGASQVAEIRARLAQAEAAVIEAARAVEASIIVSPIDGQVTRLSVRGVGETVQPGQTLAEIAPSGAPVLFQVAVASADVGRVRPGEIARIKVHAFPHQEYGVLEGHVESVSPDTQPQEGGGAAYRVLIRPHSETGSRAGKPIELRLGLTATVEIVTERKRIIDLFLKQIRGGQS